MKLFSLFFGLQLGADFKNFRWMLVIRNDQTRHPRFNKKESDLDYYLITVKFKYLQKIAANALKP